MSSFLMKCFQVALEGSVVLLIVMLLRLVLKRAPKKYLCFLWAVALLRLCCPYLPEGPIPAFWRTELIGEQQRGTDAESTTQLTDDLEKESRKPTAGAQMETAEPVISDPGQGKGGLRPGTDVAWDSIDQSKDTLLPNGTKSQESLEIKIENGELSNGDTGNSLAETDREAVLETTPATETFTKDNILFLLGILWLAGAPATAGWLTAKYLKLSKQLREALPVCDYLGFPVKRSDLAGLPAVFGILRPVIYVPIAFEEWEASQRELILLHEATHIRRGDHLLKWFSMLVLCLYWWNPIVWLGVKLLHRDIEMACDEAVLAGIAGDGREDYAKVLLFYAAKKSGLALPVAFGESHTEGRIRNILRYKKLPFLATVLLLAVVGTVSVCIATKPKAVEPSDPGLSITSGEGQSEQSGSQGDNPEQSSWWAEEQEYWTEKLTEEGKVQNPEEELFTFYDDQDFAEDDRGIYLRAGILAAVISSDGEMTLYQSKADILDSGRGAAENEVRREIVDIDSREKLRQLTLLPCSQYLLEIEEDAKTRKVMELIGEGANAGDLKDPVESCESLLRLKGGSGEFIPRGDKSGYVEYTFADGDSAFIEVYRVGDLWYPSFIPEAWWEGDPQREQSDKAEFEEALERMQQAEKVVNDSVKADFDGDGVPEKVVISVTCGTQSVTGWRELLQTGEACYVRVYPAEAGTVSQKEWEHTGGYDINCALWESRPLTNHIDETGFVYLVTRDGKQSILSSRTGMSQGIFESKFQVYAIKEGSPEFTLVDEAAVILDLNATRVDDIRERFDVDALMEYTEKLNAWTSHGILLAKTDANNQAILQETGSEKYEAWEIWREVEQIINRDYVFATGETVTSDISGMTTLADEMAKLKERRIVFGREMESQPQLTLHIYDEGKDRTVYIKEYLPEEGEYGAFVVQPLIFFYDSDTEKKEQYGFPLDEGGSYYVVEPEVEWNTYPLARDVEFQVINWDMDEDLIENSIRYSREPGICVLTDAEVFLEQISKEYPDGGSHYPFFIRLNVDGEICNVYEPALP